MKFHGNIGLAYCQGPLYLTEDCGDTWRKIEVKSEVSYDAITHFSMPDSNAIFVTASQRLDSIWVFFSSYDRGKTWQYLNKSPMNKYPGFNNVTYVDRKNGWATGSLQNIKYDQYRSPSIFKTSDGGLNWEQQLAHAELILGGLSEPNMADTLNGIITSNYSLFYTTDGGKYWKKYYYYFNNKPIPPYPTVRGSAFPTIDRPIIIAGGKMHRFIGHTTGNNEEYIADNPLSLRPNPAGDYIEINLDRWTPPSRWSPSYIKIYNTLGECVISDVRHLEDVGHLKRIDISQLPAGVYFVRIGDRALPFVKY